MLDAAIGFSEETAYGEATTSVNRWYEFVSEGLKQDINRIESAGIRAGARYLRTGRWANGRRQVGGEVVFELNDKGMGRFFKHMNGTIVTTGTGPFVHTASPGNLNAMSLRAHVLRPDLNGVRRPFAYTGLKVRSWSLSCSLDQYARLGLTFLGREERTADPAGTPDYTTVGNPVPFTSGSLTIGGVPVPVKEVTLEGTNAFEEDARFNLGATLRDQPREYGLRDLTAGVDADWTDLTLYNRFVSGTEASLVLTFSGVLVVTLNVRTEGETPTVGGLEEIRQPVSMKAIAQADGVGGITFAYTTSDATP